MKQFKEGHPANSAQGWQKASGTQSAAGWATQSFDELTERKEECDVLSPRIRMLEERVEASSSQPKQRSAFLALFVWYDWAEMPSVYEDENTGFLRPVEHDLSLAGGPSASPFYWPSVAQKTEPPLTEEGELCCIAWNFVFVLIYLVVYKG